MSNSASDLREQLLGPPRVRRRLAALRDRPVNFEPSVLERARPEEGWTTTALRQPLPAEGPGSPADGGSWDIARRLMRGYEFADPSIVRAYYDPEVPLENRNMLLKLQAFGLLHLYVGVRVADVYEVTRHDGNQDIYVWGWSYRTLEGHVEMGQMDWEVWKWADTGIVEFHVHAVSKTAPIPNPLIRVGFELFKGPERRAFLDGTKTRMRGLVELALRETGEDEFLETARTLTKRRSREVAAHRGLARNLDH